MKYLKNINEDASAIKLIDEHEINNNPFYFTTIKLLVELGFNNSNLTSVPYVASDEYFKILLFFNKLPEIHSSENNKLNIKRSKLKYYTSLIIVEKDDIQIAQINIKGKHAGNIFNTLDTFLLDAALYNLIIKNIPFEYIVKYKSMSKDTLDSIVDAKKIGLI